MVKVMAVDDAYSELKLMESILRSAINEGRVAAGVPPAPPRT